MGKEGRLLDGCLDAAADAWSGLSRKAIPFYIAIDFTYHGISRDAFEFVGDLLEGKACFV